MKNLSRKIINLAFPILLSGTIYSCDKGANHIDQETCQIYQDSIQVLNKKLYNIEIERDSFRRKFEYCDMKKNWHEMGIYD